MTIATLALLVPVLVAGLLALTAPWERRAAAAVGAVAAAIAAAALCAVLLADLDGGRLVLWLGGWEPRDGVAVGIDVAIDPFGAGLALFAAALAVPALVLAGRLVLASPQRFHAILLLLIAAMVGFCLTGDLFNLFVFFELMSVAAYVLVGYEVRQRAPLEGALTFAVTNTVGSILLLFGIGLVYGETGALNLAQIGRTLGETGASGPVIVAFGLIATGLLVKAAALPFHLWVADAYAVAPTPVCILLAGVFSELGLYGLARVWWTAFEPALGDHAGELRAVLVCLGLVTGLVAGALALAQHHLKRLLAYVTVAQIGIMLVGIGLLNEDGLAGAAIFLVGDGFVKATLFVAIAVVQHRYHHIDVRALHGRARDLRLLAAVYVAAALAVAGLPPFGSFVGRALIEDAALKEPGYAWVPAVLALVSALSAAPLLRAGARVFGGWGARAPHDPMGELGSDAETSDEDPAEPRTTSPWLVGPAVALLAAALGWGLVPGLVHAVGHAAAVFADTEGYILSVLGGVPAHVPAPPIHEPGVTALLYAAASVSAGLVLAAAGLGERRLPGWAQPVVNGLRAVHSGHFGDYVAWTAAGATVLTALFALSFA